jgi:hypothetical protein
MEFLEGAPTGRSRDLRPGLGSLLLNCLGIHYFLQQPDDRFPVGVAHRAS